MLACGGGWNNNYPNSKSLKLRRPMSDNNGWFGKLLKALGTTVIVILVIVAVGFGLLVGFCGLMSMR